MANKSNRRIVPKVINTFDTPVVYINCEPERDEIKLDVILHEILNRFELVLGTSFDLQFRNMGDTKVLAVQRYMVTQVTKELSTSGISNYQTMSKTLYHRSCRTISKLKIFDPEGDHLLSVFSQDKSTKRRRVADISDEALDFKEADLGDMSQTELKNVMKDVTGKPVPIGISRAHMIEEIKEAKKSVNA